jgi:hypothetical protein
MDTFRAEMRACVPIIKSRIIAKSHNSGARDSAFTQAAASTSEFLGATKFRESLPLVGFSGTTPSMQVRGSRIDIAEILLPRCSASAHHRSGIRSDVESTPMIRCVSSEFCGRADGLDQGTPTRADGIRKSENLSLRGRRVAGVSGCGVPPARTISCGKTARFTPFRAKPRRSQTSDSRR